LDGRAALVTGSSRGIGRAIALGLAECGARVAVHGSKPSGALDQALAAVRTLSPACAAVTGDLSNPDEPARIVARAAAALGSLDILVLNAAIHPLKPWEEVLGSEAEEQMQVNFHASLRMIQAAVPAMRARKWGRIVTLGSVAQKRPRPEMAIYAASKSAQENLVRNLAAQLGPDGININNLSPGAVPMNPDKPSLGDQARAARRLALIPVGFFGRAEDMVGAALLLCSDAGRYITGADLRADGGMGAI
jgi:NAD(P)-dependent dehydrogenase (short-subunit alcohol dehydrogenase family)